MNWFSNITGDIGHWVGNEWNNVRPWLPEIGLGAGAAAAAVFAPYLLPEIAGAAEGIGAGAGAAEAIGAGGGELGLGAAADLGTASELGTTAATAGAADLSGSMGAGLGSVANADAAIGAAGPSITGGAGMPVDWGATTVPGGETGFGAGPTASTWNTPGGDELAGGSAMPPPDLQNAPVPGAPASGQDVIAQTFGADYTPPAQNVNPGVGLGGTPDPTMGGGGGPLSSVFGSDSVLGSMSGTQLARYGIPLAGLAYTMMRGEPGQPRAAGQAGGIARTESNFGQDWLTRAQNGNLTADQQAQIDIFRQNSVNQLRQQFAATGRDWRTDSGYNYGLQQIDQQATAMRTQFIQLMITQGLRASGQATQTLMQIAQLQYQQDRDYQQTLSNFMRQFGMAMSGQPQSINVRLAG